MTRPRASRVLLLVGWLLALAMAGFALARAGGLLPPMPASAAELRASLDQYGVAPLALTALRPLALAALAYQFAVTVITVAGAVTSSAALVALSRRAPGSVARSVVRHALGAGLTATAVTSLAPAAAFAQTTTLPAPEAPPSAQEANDTDDLTPPARPGEPIIMVRIPARPRSHTIADPGGPTDTSTIPDDRESSHAAVMVSLDSLPDEPSPGIETTVDDPDPLVAPDDEEAASAPGGLTPPTTSSTVSGGDLVGAGEDHEPGRPISDAHASIESDIGADGDTDTWQIETGDHLWSIAAETLAEEWDREPSDDDVLHYWDALLRANRERLIDPANPDLIFPGQVLVLPPVPEPAASGG